MTAVIDVVVGKSEWENGDWKFLIFLKDLHIKPICSGLTTGVAKWGRNKKNILHFFPTVSRSGTGSIIQMTSECVAMGVGRYSERGEMYFKDMKL